MLTDMFTDTDITDGGAELVCHRSSHVVAYFSAEIAAGDFESLLLADITEGHSRHVPYPK